MNTTPPEEYIPSFRRRQLDEPGFLRKLARFASRLGQPVVCQLYALYFLFKSPYTPKRAKMIILDALVYFFNPIDSISDMLGPLGFSDDIAAITLVYSQVKTYPTEDVRERARQAVENLFGKKSRCTDTK